MESNRNIWLGYKEYFGHVDSDGLKPDVVEALTEIYASLSAMFSAILDTQYADVFWPNSSMDTIIHIWWGKKYFEGDSDDWLKEMPSVHFAAFTEDRFDITYSRSAPDSEPEEHHKLTGTAARDKVMELLRRMYDEGKCQQNNSGSPD